MALTTPRWAIVALFSTTVFLSLGARLSADTIAYAAAAATDSSSVFGTLDLNTGAFSEISSLGGVFVEDLAMSTNGTVYALAGSFSGDSPAEFATINTSTGAITDIAALSDPLTSIAFSPNGTLYATTYSTTQEALYTVDPTTGAASFVTNLQGPLATEADDIRFLGNTLYTTSYATPSALYSVNLQTGAGTLIGDSGLPEDNALGGVENGDLLASASNTGIIGAPGELALIDPVTGAATVGPTTNLQYLFTTAATPEPASLSLLVGGLVLMAGILTRRRA